MACPTCFCVEIADTGDASGAGGRARAALGLVLHRRPLLPQRRQRAADDALALSPVDDPQARDVVGPVRHVRVRRLRALHHVVPGRHRHHRGGRGDPRLGRAGGCAVRTIDVLLSECPVFAGLDAVDLELIAGCGRNVRFGAEQYLFREGEPADTFYVLRHGAVTLEMRVPARRPLVIETLHDGDVVGWSWLVPPYRWAFDARAAEPDRRGRARRRVPAREVRARTRPSGYRAAAALLARDGRAPAGRAAADARRLRRSSWRLRRILDLAHR